MRQRATLPGSRNGGSHCYEDDEEEDDDDDELASSPVHKFLS